MHLEQIKAMQILKRLGIQKTEKKVGFENLKEAANNARK
jgi:hypothetical protein